jgi:alpha-galactosidase
VVGGGHFADPDYLVPDQGMSANEAQSQISMWAMMAVPMMLSANPASLSTRRLRMVANPEAIAISQDPLGVQGRMMAPAAAQTWVKPLANYEKAVAFFNPAPSVARGSATAATVGFPGARCLLAHDVCAHRTPLLGPRITVDVPAHGTILLRIAAVR